MGSAGIGRCRLGMSLVGTRMRARGAGVPVRARVVYAKKSLQHLATCAESLDEKGTDLFFADPTRRDLTPVCGCSSSRLGGLRQEESSTPRNLRRVSRRKGDGFIFRRSYKAGPDPGLRYTEVAGDALTLPDFLERRFHDASRVLRWASAGFTLLFFTFYASRDSSRAASCFSRSSACLMAKRSPPTRWRS